MERDDNVKEYLDHWRDALVVPWVKVAADARAEADALRATVEGGRWRRRMRRSRRTLRLAGGGGAR